MEKKWLKRAILSAVLGSSFLGLLPSVEAAEVRILPVDKAKFWAGAKFDFDVEVKGDQQLKDVAITVNGQPADKFFGQKLVKKDLGNGVTSYRADQVTFPKTGAYEVKVTAQDGAGKGVSAAGYTVVSEKASKRAKNVILFVGDGMSLQAREIARILSMGLMTRPSWCLWKISGKLTPAMAPPLSIQEKKAT